MFTLNSFVGDATKQYFKDVLMNKYSGKSPDSIYVEVNYQKQFRRSEAFKKKNRMFHIKSNQLLIKKNIFQHFLSEVQADSSQKIQCLILEEELLPKINYAQGNQN